MTSHHHPSNLPSGGVDASGIGDASAAAGAGRDVLRSFASARVDEKDASNNATTRAR